MVAQRPRQDPPRGLLVGRAYHPNPEAPEADRHFSIGFSWWGRYPAMCFCGMHSRSYMGGGGGVGPGGGILHLSGF